MSLAQLTSEKDGQKQEMNALKKQVDDKDKEKEAEVWLHVRTFQAFNVVYSCRDLRRVIKKKKLNCRRR